MLWTHLATLIIKKTAVLKRCFRGCPCVPCRSLCISVTAVTEYVEEHEQTSAAIDLYLYMTCIYSLTGMVLQYVSWVNHYQVSSSCSLTFKYSLLWGLRQLPDSLEWSLSFLVTKSTPSPTPHCRVKPVDERCWVAERSCSVCWCVWINRLGPPLAPATALQSHFGNSLYGVWSW